MRRVLAAALCAGAVLSGCGGPGSGLSASAATVLQKDAAALAAAARAHDGVRVQAALAVLRRDVAAQRAKQALSAERADRVLGAAVLVAADVPAPVVTAKPEVTTPPPAPAPAPARKKKHGHSEDHGD